MGAWGVTGRRGFLRAATGLLASLPIPHLRAEAASGDGLKSIDVDLASIPAGQIREVEWQGKPVFVRHRTAEEVARAQSTPLDALRDPEPDDARVQRPPWVVVVGLCTHAGCIPKGPLGDYGGWYCFCHGSQFDTSGRVRAGPARVNLTVPPYRFLSDQTIRVGE